MYLEWVLLVCMFVRTYVRMTMCKTNIWWFTLCVCICMCVCVCVCVCVYIRTYVCSAVNKVLVLVGCISE